MSIRSAIMRSKDDNDYFDTKSYSNLNPDFEVIDAKEFVKGDNDLAKRIYEREYTIDNVKKLIRLFNKGEELITVNQLRDFFDDAGFNTDATLSAVHGADIMMVYNLGGYLVPGWRTISKIIYSKKPEYKSLLLTKLSPGKKRFHCRVSQYSDGSWYITSHIDDSNWMNFLNPVQAYKSHMMKGTGNFDLGSEIMSVVMDMILKSFKDRKNLFVDIEPIFTDLSEKKAK